ncbi:hypothetical protein VE01_09782 [Pseudogymnoascus verrucosus]|uniref:DSC E3 ubiquitin ligase complex subunit A n=1 Tax=Pseudogymnoascus verrucosus TaxID=342668 RepID=A0A1B8G8E3_9PEZI|nr:uncharacterized protein VE01_09782 [Pseudogymnoascus verrucosus]OBT92098.1 hypothetical protein VE01_09782 [Pseudogymnoascus verrucosus]
MNNENRIRPGAPVTGQPPHPGFVIMMIMMMYFYSSPAGGPPPGMISPRELFNTKMARESHSLDVLNQTRWGDFLPREIGEDKEMGADVRYVNITGFREEDGYSWGRLRKVKERFETFQQAAKHGLEKDWALYENVTGIVKGPWVKSQGSGFENQGVGGWGLNLSAIAPGTNWAWNQWNRNITGAEGKAMMRIEDYSRVPAFGEPGEQETRPIVPGAPREVTATLTVQDESSTGDGWDMRLHGIQWPQTGALVLTTTSNKFAGIYGLPHLTSNKDEFNDTQHALNKTLGDILHSKQKSAWIDLRDPWSEDSMLPLPHCEYVAYVQVYPMKKEQISHSSKLDEPSLQTAVQRIEQELRFPTGAPLSKAPPLQMSFIVFSPDCDFVLESKGPPSYAPAQGLHLQGYKLEAFISRVKNWLLVWGTCLFGQVLLLLSQMKDASTPSTVGRISFYTISFMLAVDFTLFLSLMMVANAAPAVFPTMTLAGFSCAMAVGLGARFLADINKVQAPERRERERERDRAQAAARAPQAAQATVPPTAPLADPAPVTTGIPIITPGGAEVLPLAAPINAPAAPAAPAVVGNGPIIVPSDQDVDAEIADNLANGAAAIPAPATAQRVTIPPLTRRQEMAASLGPALLGLMFFFLLSVSSISWPPAARTFYVNMLSSIYLSFWVPQIYRNIMRNCRKALLRKFVIGQSLLRAAPIAYFYLRKDNIFFAETSGTTMAMLGGWLWLQVWILFAQEVLGPRFGLPKTWLPEAWDYHPILRDDDVEGGEMPIGLAQAAPDGRRSTEEPRKKRDGHSRTVDCAICMNALEVPIAPARDEGEKESASTGGVQGMLARRVYMVTPCRHVFHSVCLEGWMKFRLQCPICRETLPPL